MTPAERLRLYRQRQLELLAGYGELQKKIEESARAGQAELLAAQALEARRLAAECTELERAIRQLAPAARHLAGRTGGDRLGALEARLDAGRESALEAGRRSQAALSASLRELAARIRELQARPRTPPSPFTRIGRPVLVDLRS
jgi:hypothetical protein